MAYCSKKVRERSRQFGTSAEVSGQMVPKCLGSEVSDTLEGVCLNTADHRRLPQITTDHRRWPQMTTADQRRSLQITR